MKKLFIIITPIMCMIAFFIGTICGEYNKTTTAYAADNINNRIEIVESTYIGDSIISIVKDSETDIEYMIGTKGNSISIFPMISKIESYVNKYVIK